MKISGFAQLHNEHSNGNLTNWLRSMLSVCDEIFIYDQGSEDDSRSIYERYSNVHVTYSPTNDFGNELACKAALLRALLAESPDTDWILWMDGDTLLDARLDRSGLESVLFHSAPFGDLVLLGHHNLWRSDVLARVDDQFDYLHQVGVAALWKNTGTLSFPEGPGLHGTQHPAGLPTAVRVPFNLIHRGFASDESILRKHRTYQGLGQTGWALDRLVNEQGLDVRRVSDDELPDWLLPVDATDPRVKPALLF